MTAHTPLRLPPPRPLDIVWASIVGVFVLASPGIIDLASPAATALGLLWGALYVLPIVWRRADADLAALALIPAHLIQLAVYDAPTPANVTVPLMIFTAAAYGRLRFRLGWLGGGLIASLLAAVDWVLAPAVQRADGDINGVWANTVPALVFTFAGLASLIAASWAIGAFVRARADASLASRDAVAAQHLQHQQAVELATTQERQRLAREMHDVVAHSLAVIVVQADGGAYAASMGGDPAARLATAEKALTTIRATAQDALVETRRLVGVLRSDQATELTPASGLGDIFDLVQGLAQAGRDVRMQVTGDRSLRRFLSPGLELAAYRIVQEALTNTVKHAGEHASVLVHVHHAASALIVQVRDNGAGCGNSDGLGHGLIGMRERVGAFGGTLTAQNHPDGGFVVTAHFPLTQGALR